MRKPSSTRLLLWLGAALLLTVAGMTDASTGSKSTPARLSKYRSQAHAVIRSQQDARHSGGWMMLPVCLIVAGYSMRRQQRSLSWHQPLTV